ncbi:MAG: zinc-binding dehydrogenase [Eubacteriales bacterium]
MKATAAVFEGTGKPFSVRTFDVTETPAGYGRSELIASGICGTDIHFWDGTLQAPKPSIIGHEFVGKLVDCDAAEAAAYGLSVGDNVIADIAVPCGTCLLCKTGDEANCVNMGVTNGGSIEEAPYLWGGYTEVNYTPLSNLIRIPESLNPKAVAAFACPGPTAMHAFKLASRANIRLFSETVAVVQGLGPVGCYAILYLRAMGVDKVYAVLAGSSEKKIALAKALGADEVFSLSRDGEEAVAARLSEEHNGLGVDLVYEASGAPKAIPFGMRVLRNRGVYLVPGQYSASGAVSIHPETITFKALQIIGSSQYDMDDVRAYLSFLNEHKELEQTILSLVTAYPVAQINEAIADIKSGKNVKTVLVK